MEKIRSGFDINDDWQRCLEMDTQPETDETPHRECGDVVGLTVLWHHNPNRIGDICPLPQLSIGKAVVLSRLEPLFFSERNAPPRPLADANTSDFKILRPRHDDPDEKLEWQPLRKGVADIHRRAEVSQRSNERYIDALSVVEDTTPCSPIFDAVARPVVCDGRRFRAMRIGDAEDIALLEAISRGEFVTAGFRNRDLQKHLYPGALKATIKERGRISAKISRQLRLLRAHGIIKKTNRTYRYQLTKRGRQLTAALQAARSSNLNQALQQTG